MIKINKPATRLVEIKSGQSQPLKPIPRNLRPWAPKYQSSVGERLLSQDSQIPVLSNFWGKLTILTQASHILSRTASGQRIPSFSWPWRRAGHLSRPHQSSSWVGEWDHVSERVLARHTRKWSFVIPCSLLSRTIIDTCMAIFFSSGVREPLKDVHSSSRQPAQSEEPEPVNWRQHATLWSAVCPWPLEFSMGTSPRRSMGDNWGVGADDGVRGGSEATIRTSMPVSIWSSSGFDVSSKFNGVANGVCLPAFLLFHSRFILASWACDVSILNSSYWVMVLKNEVKAVDKTGYLIFWNKLN